jgi:hypothetical protein
MQNEIYQTLKAMVKIRNIFVQITTLFPEICGVFSLVIY